MEYQNINPELLIVRLEQVNQRDGQIIIEFNYSEKSTGHVNRHDLTKPADETNTDKSLNRDKNSGYLCGFKDTITLSDSQNDVERLSELLQTRDVKLNLLDKFGLAPLHYCANVDRIDIAKMLIERGADVDLAGDIGCWRIPYLPSIYHALKTFHFELLHLLLSHSMEAFRRIPLGGDGLGLVTYVPHAFKSYVYEIESICPYSFLLLQVLRSVVNPDRLTNYDSETQQNSFNSAVKCFHILYEFGIPISQEVLGFCVSLLKGREWIAPHLPENKNQILLEFYNMVLWKGTHPQSLRCLSRRRVREQVTENVSNLTGLIPSTVENYINHQQCPCHISVVT